MVKERKKGRRSKDEWKSMNATELSRLMAHRVGRIEILKLEIKELQKLIEEKSR